MWTPPRDGQGMQSAARNVTQQAVKKPQIGDMQEGHSGTRARAHQGEYGSALPWRWRHGGAGVGLAVFALSCLALGSFRQFLARPAEPIFA